MTATTRGAVETDPRVVDAYPFLPRQAAVNSIWQGPTGELVRVNADGGGDEVNGIMPRRSIAADPTARVIEA